MALWILQNQYATTVLADLKVICPGVTVDVAGRVSYKKENMLGVGCSLIALVDTLGTVAIRGEHSEWSIEPQLGHMLGRVAGVAMPDRYAGTRAVDVVYDATDCRGKGFYTYDIAGVMIRLPRHVILFHELVHAARLFRGIFKSDGETEELETILDENLYRQLHGLPPRGQPGGGCIGDTSGPGKPVPVPGSPGRVAPGICTPLLIAIPRAIGTDHVKPISAARPGERTYDVIITNKTPDTFTEIVLAYKRIGQSGIVFLKFEEVKPEQMIGFVCGLTKDFESYAVSFYIGNDEVLRFPSTGVMTPERASIENPTDQDPCVDFWKIAPTTSP